jgi:fibroblast growth factor receptor 2/cadherin 2 type 1 (N-cadherin)
MTDDMEPDTVPLYSGRSVRLVCKFEANPAANITWFKNGKPFTTRRNGEVWQIKPDHLYLENVSPSDEGDYTCFAKNNRGNASHTYHVMIENSMPYPPPIDTGILHSRHDITAGENVTLACKYNSVAAATSRWRRYNDTTGKWQVLQSEVFVPNVGDVHYLVISNFSPADQGTYQCETNNTYGFNAHEITLKIMKEPEASRMPPPPSRLTTDIAIAAGGVVGILIIIIVSVKMQKYKKNHITVVHAEQSFIIRRVVLEHDAGGKCLSPRVKIETEAVNLNQLGAAEKKRALNEYMLPLDKDWEVSRERLIFAEKLGEGAFGVVFRATARGITDKDDHFSDVAVKMLKDPHTDNDLRDLVSEMEVMKKVGRHPNIISLLGCVTQDGLFSRFSSSRTFCLFCLYLFQKQGLHMSLWSLQQTVT